MVSRYDAVLVAIPTLALGGVVLGRLFEVLYALSGLGSYLALVPFGVVGLVAALAVIGRELLVVGHPASRRPRSGRVEYPDR